MDKRFWLERWRNNEIGFHRSDVNPLLIKYFNELPLAKGDRVFLPLCGKTLDITWLLSEGYRVVGVELAETAIEQLFAGLQVDPQILQEGKFKHYKAEHIDVFVGNFFELSGQILGAVDGVYDRAALVALPQDMRNQYTEHLTKMIGQAPQLLITYDYDQNEMEGPPFSISNEEVKRHYANKYRIKLIESMDLPGGLKGKCSARENVWLLAKKNLA